MKPLRTRLQEARQRLGVPWDVLERDYLLSWVLAGVGRVPSLRDTLVFKGGTALKKCYFGDYRFSEDLDFSTQGDAPAGKQMEQAMDAACASAVQLLDEYAPVDILCERYTEKDPHPGGQETFTIHARFPWQRQPHTRVTVEVTMDEKVRPRKQWNYAGHTYLSGEIKGTRIDAAALDLVPLRLNDMGMWDPQEHYWGEEDEPIEDWARPIIAGGPRPELEMEQVLPGEDPEDFDWDPIMESVAHKDAGDRPGAKKILMEMLESDLRCLDAHAHLGSLAFDYSPEVAIRSYEIGVRIGELSLGDNFSGVLPWGCIDNRPFLRCMHGYGLCLWRLERLDEAERVFDRMLWLNPTDNQGICFMLPEVREGASWESCEDI